MNTKQMNKTKQRWTHRGRQQIGGYQSGNGVEGGWNKKKESNCVVTDGN